MSSVSLPYNSVAATRSEAAFDEAENNARGEEEDPDEFPRRVYGPELDMRDLERTWATLPNRFHIVVNTDPNAVDDHAQLRHDHNLLKYECFTVTRALDDLRAEFAAFRAEVTVHRVDVLERIHTNSHASAPFTNCVAWPLR